MKRSLSILYPVIAISMIATLTACESTIRNHGSALDPALLERIEVGETRRIEIETLFGKASAEGAFDSGKIYYIAQTMEEAPLRQNTTIVRTVIAFSFDTQDVLQDITVLDVDNATDVIHLTNQTPTPGDRYGFWEQIFRNIQSGNVGGN